MPVSLDIQHNAHVATLQFHNPPYNFATVELLRVIADALHALDEEPNIRAIVLCAGGKSFCAGADLVSENGFGAAGDDPLREFYDQAIRIFAARKPIVAAVQGPAIGAGLGLAVAADFRVASPAARFAANFVKLGFHPGFGLTHTLPRLLGAQRASLMCLTGLRYKAEEVAAWGLVDAIAAPDSLLEAAQAFAADIAENAPLGLLATRATLRRELVAEVTAALQREHAEQIKLQDTEDFAEGVRAVGERRPGNFQGR
ncbi:enoyl-CoA hydratase/isomerase family protein [Mangrovimicrobium sediminis]|uniref:Enoyl-CoA hydratase/isomerase family protein n=1 Tax=Mangrovimicrobium sediminis TaxID=2562682 RepID=A0A4Z0M141_9GAMM|nr:enoyl-CoA hydratase/isomerase family protein [Haliea sp. SAOS-164]TGD73403.1 enoyl-CoA hydratase/isomerase family protein [Haliea sp. SAOS-164]